MSFARLKKWLRNLPYCVARKFDVRTSALLKLRSGSMESTEQKRWRPQLLAHRLLGETTNHLTPLFQDLESGLRKSDIRMSFKPYVSLTIFASSIVASCSLLLIPPLLHYILGVPLFPSLLFGVGISMLAGALSIICFYGYPLFRADSIERSLNDSMAFTTGYLAILAGAGVPPSDMFRSLSGVPQQLAIVDESRIIVRDVDLFGADIFTALENASKRTPSEKFKELLEGFIATIRSGGDLKSYLMDRSRQSMEAKRIDLKKFSDTLGILSEFYVSLLVAGPLILIVMLAVMAMLGGFGFGTLDPLSLLMLLAYIGIPIGSVVFMLVLDALMPG